MLNEYLGCHPQALLLNEMSSKVAKSWVSLRETGLQNSNELDGWWTFCPCSSFWIP